MKSYVEFHEVQMKPGRKTKGWLVLSTSKSKLGVVVWYSQWRCYCFFPDSRTVVLSAGCLHDIAGFVDEQTRLHKAAAA